MKVSDHIKNVVCLADGLVDDCYTYFTVEINVDGRYFVASLCCYEYFKDPKRNFLDLEGRSKTLPNALRRLASDIQDHIDQKG